VIIKKIKLHNIRSYVDEVIDFPLGTTLFEGDIGSGKSTILMAIEFALFGLGSERGASLLRTGESEGQVSLVFDVNGHEYMVTRTLTKKGKAVQQAEGSITTPEGKLILSPSELKEKVLEILNFNEPIDPKAQSIIYRYAVFTPQEEMKSILYMKPDMRLQTLRKAFRIEDYKTAAENAQHLSTKLKLEVAQLEAAASNIFDIKSKIEDLNLRVSQQRKALAELRERQQGCQSTFYELSRQKEELHSAEVERSRVIADIDHLERLVRNLEEQQASSRARVQELDRKLEFIEGGIKQLASVQMPTERPQEVLEQEIRRLRALETEFRREESKLEKKLEDYQNIYDHGVCPTCDREVAPDEFIGKLESAAALKDQASRKVQGCLKMLEDTERLLEARRRYDDAQRDLEKLRRQEQDYKEEIDQLRRKIQSTEEDIQEVMDRLAEARGRRERLDEALANLPALNNRIRTVEEELNTITREVSSTEATVANWDTQVREYQAELRKREEQKRMAEILGEYQIWIDDYFIPTLELIEKHVMLNINHDFDHRFQRWFNMMIDDPGKEARIDEDFTPIIEQDGYEQEIGYLSGGEKTSAALAYRLALNSIVQKVSTGLQSNLIILDEPTDGFSKEQLSGVREILDELRSPQVILVSHERELESFADQIYRVTKSGGQSRVTLAS